VTFDEFLSMAVSDCVNAKHRPDPPCSPEVLEAAEQAHDAVVEDYYEAKGRFAGEE
jgi:hypothetical protein